MGQAAAQAVSERITDLLQSKDTINMIFAAAPSQNEFLEALRSDNTIDWKRINAFHMDEYVGLPEDAPQRFANFLKLKIFDAMPFRAVHYLNGNAPDPAAECTRYETLLNKMPADIVCMGIGENTHIAFNDPHVADFNDTHLVKVVDLDMECRQQQVNDACFAVLEQVPTHALTLTVPALVRAAYIFCMVPGEKKANAVYHTLHEHIGERYPSTILRTHGNATLYVDADSAARI
ncbi:glucosamine-6-phosphate deaminase [Chryseolinea sp. Jin1]|uniref:Glucosamine-6-phosphate deaminase n=2 Tax=Chryseolinea lacunae TaxID=2801331 RepID=A0ABS1KUR7_9BACT|nr:glucosamine-6-phosphate deaminase [Chryseolinea lacunae]